MFFDGRITNARCILGVEPARIPGCKAQPRVSGCMLEVSLHMERVHLDGVGGGKGYADEIRCMYDMSIK